MTASELIALLETLDPETPVMVDYDCQGPDAVDTSDFHLVDGELVLVV